MWKGKEDGLKMNSRHIINIQDKKLFEELAIQQPGT